MATTSKIAFSIKPEMLKILDAAAARTRVSRSRFIRDAIDEAIRRAREDDLARRIDAAFDDPATAENQLRTSERFLGASVIGVSERSEDRW